MYFSKLKTTSLALTLGLGLASAASATCMAECSPGNEISVTGLAGFAGILMSEFDAGSGLNEAWKDGYGITNIDLTGTGLCGGDPCGDTTLQASVEAGEVGGVYTAAEDDESGATTSLANSGQLNALSALNIMAGGNNTDAMVAGAALFGAAGQSTVVGDNVHTAMEGYGSGDVVTHLATNGTVCPTCADFTGVSNAQSSAGLTIWNHASGGSPLSIQNAGQVVAGALTGADYQTAPVDPQP